MTQFLAENPFLINFCARSKCRIHDSPLAILSTLISNNDCQFSLCKAVLAMWRSFGRRHIIPFLSQSDSINLSLDKC